MTILVMNVLWAVGGGAINIIYDQLGGVYFAQKENWNPDSIVATFMSAAGIGLFIGMMLSPRVAAVWSRGDKCDKKIHRYQHYTPRSSLCGRRLPALFLGDSFSYFYFQSDHRLGICSCRRQCFRDLCPIT